MSVTQVFFSNIISILDSRKLSLSWLEEMSGINKVFLSTYRWISAGLSFQLVIKIAMALNVSIKSLISNDGTIEFVSYRSRDPEVDYIDFYRRFWASVDYEATRQGKTWRSLAAAAGKTIPGLVYCATKDNDIEIQRAEAIALLLDSSIDELVWQPLPCEREEPAIMVPIL